MKIRYPAVALSLLALNLTVPARAADVTLHWLDGSSPPAASGVSWGVPFPQGTVQKNQAFTLTANGTTLPLQTWPLAYWPDGSMKWIGFATTATPGMTSNLTLSTSAPASGATAGTLKATDTPTYIQIDTGPLQAVISKSGANLIDWMAVNGYSVAQNGQLVCILQDGPEMDNLNMPKREKFVSTVKKVTLEQSGPVRAVVKVEGMHKGAQSGREWLPFTVRLYFYTGETSVRMVHTIVYDGDQAKDFIRGLGVTFGVPMREQTQNRHVRFSGDGDGLWAEPIQGGMGNAAQAAGQPINAGGSYGPNGAYAIWDDFKLTQPTPSGFTIEKRTNPQSTWLFVDAGKRSTGLAFVGDTSGGLGISVKNFWQSFPDGFDIQHANGETAQLTAWLWSPDAPAMDMRHYDIVAHGLGPTYEDVQPGMSTPYGVARTSELTLYPSGTLPSKPDTVALAKAGQELPLIAASPQYIHSTGVFGVWSLQDRSTPFKAAVEDRLDNLLKFYEDQRDERNWYGFWHYGDFIHSYNNAQHEWYYDFGGHAWDNTELGVPLWLWYSFLRTGRADLFRLAEAHTRNTSETNVYHLGPMAGLGSRHNVIKWGDGAKEARISQAAHWRPFYYLTTDERTGDIMHEQAYSDLAAIRFDPMREAQPVLPQDPQYPGRVRIGPDWFAFAGNWMAEWERTGDTKWRDRILAGVDSIMAMPYWLRSGVRNGLNPDLGGDRIGPLKGGGSMTVGYDPATGKLLPIPDPIAHDQVPVNYNLTTIQGGAEVMFELLPLLKRDDFAKAWLQYCRLGGNIPENEGGVAALSELLKRDQVTGNERPDASLVETAQGGPRLAAWAYAQTKNPAFAQRAIGNLAGGGRGARGARTVNPPDVLNSVQEGLGDTNGAAQNSLTAIEILELCADQLPTEVPANRGGAPGAGRGNRGNRGGPPADAPANNAPAPANQ